MFGKSDWWWIVCVGRKWVYFGGFLFVWVDGGVW